MRLGAGGAITIGGYLAVFVVGLFEGLIGSFQFGRGPVPLFAIVFCLLILATCMLSGWAFGTLGGALVPAVGWVIASFVLSMPDSQGSVIITNTTAGKWYLYGGTFCVVVGVTASFVLWARTQHRHSSSKS